MLTDKTKEAFNEFLNKQRFGITHYVNERQPNIVDLTKEFKKLPFSMQYGIYIDFFDENGIYIDVLTEFEYGREVWEDKNGKEVNPHYVPENWYFTINDNSKEIGFGNSNETRSEARKNAILKANKLFLENNLK